MKTWNSIPPSITTVEILQKKGSMTDLDLLKELKGVIEDFNSRELNDLLLKLEIRGIVRVTRLMKGKRQVELASR